MTLKGAGPAETVEFRLRAVRSTRDAESRAGMFSHGYRHAVKKRGGVKDSRKRKVEEVIATEKRLRRLQTAPEQSFSRCA